MRSTIDRRLNRLEQQLGGALEPPCRLIVMNPDETTDQAFERTLLERPDFAEWWRLWREHNPGQPRPDFLFIGCTD